ncbi:MAG: Xaa-Pro dipeptidase [Marinobacterium sp.]|nr:Xaa-Pro dipeptidase [Marinobacterium sp.]
MDKRFFDHLSQLQVRTEQALSETGFNALLIASGPQHGRFLDDTRYPFRACPHFVQWLPFVTEVPDCWLLIKPGQKPLLLLHSPDDFWHMTPQLPQAWWCDGFDIVPYQQRSELVQRLATEQWLAVISELNADFVPEGSLHNPQALIHQLNFTRAVKTEWELHCLREANRIAMKGHAVAEQLFYAGASEYQIHQAYLNAIAHNERDMPYDNIVALNEHAAVLHYQFQQRSVPQRHRTLLIDAGAVHLGYAADITRTFTPPGTDFAALVEEMDKAQQQILMEVKAGVCFVELHERMHLLIAGVLQRSGLVNASPQRIVEQGISRAFFPHGLGHLLGLQVHDVGGWQQTADGTEQPAPKKHPFLRLTRVLEENYVITIEPGLYFIPSLLAPLRSGAQAGLVNWSLVDALTPYGGIRIEDNVAVTTRGCENFTRAAGADA